jgi:hypothetical protein
MTYLIDVCPSLRELENFIGIVVRLNYVCLIRSTRTIVVLTKELLKFINNFGGILRSDFYG